MVKFAVIETGVKQYRVSEGDIITIEKIKGDAETGSAIVFDKVLLTDDGKDTKVGTPYIEKVSVKGALEASGKGKKITVIRYKAKSRYFKKKGHRQPFFKVRIGEMK